MKPITYLLCAISIHTATPVLAQSLPADINPAEVLVRGKNITVTAADFYTDLERIPKEKQTEFLTSPERVERLLARLAQIKTMDHAARTSGMDKDPLVQARLNAVVSKELANMYVEKLFNSIKVPNLEPRAREMYELNKRQFFEEETVHVAHILIDTKKRTKEEAIARAKEVREKLMAKTKTFDALALEYSDDPTVEQNKGNLNHQLRRTFVKPFSDAAFAMKTPGEVSQPVETEYGIHIIEFRGHRPSRTKTFDEVKGQLLTDAEREYRGAELRRLIESRESVEQGKIEAEGVAKVLPKIDITAVLNRAHEASKAANATKQTPAKK